MFSRKKKPKLLDTVLVSENLAKLAKKNKDEKTKILEIMDDFRENGILMAMIFFALPVAIPLPYPPGFTTVMGLPLIILSLQMLVGSKKVRLPLKINNYEIQNSTLIMISEKIVPIIKALEKYVKPRFSFAKSVYCEQIIGFVCLVAAMSVTLPIPFTNALPAQGMTIMALGLLNRDGVVIILGSIVAVIGIIVAIAAILAGGILIKYLFSLIF